MDFIGKTYKAIAAAFSAGLAAAVAQALKDINLGQELALIAAAFAGAFLITWSAPKNKE